MIASGTVDEIVDGVATLRAALREMIEMNKAMFRGISAAPPSTSIAIMDYMEAEQRKLGIADGYGVRAQAALDGTDQPTKSAV